MLLCFFEFSVVLFSSTESYHPVSDGKWSGNYGARPETLCQTQEKHLIVNYRVTPSLNIEISLAPRSSVLVLSPLAMQITKSSR